MEQAAEELRFERAAELRDRLRAVQELQNRQRVIATAHADTDAVAFRRGAKCCFTVLHFHDGSLTGKDFELMPEPLETDAEALAAILQQYYAARAALPRQILLPYPIEGQESLERLLTEQAGRRVHLEVPQRGERRRLTERAEQNAAEEILRATTAAQRTAKTLEWLQKALSLPAYPERIEAFDISNLGDSGIVAGMTVFQNGRPLKRDFRKFRIKEIETQNDYASMHEAVERRIRRFLDGDEKFAPLPDLLLIDGGAEHAAVAQSVLDALKVSLPVFGMVKDDRHRTRALITPQGQEIGIAGNQAVFALIGTIQEETHRYSIEYQRSLRAASLTSELDKIPGIGAKRRNDLLKAFRSVKAVREASLSDLQAIVPKNTAQAVYEYYHPKEETEPPCE
jgi:excinuclease ABC subunit C